MIVDTTKGKNMTKLLETAFNKAKALSDNEQDAIATIILEEINDEIKWDKTFAKSQKILELMASEAMAEDYAKKTEPLDPNKL